MPQNYNRLLYIIIATFLLVTVDAKSSVPTIVFVPFFSSDQTKTMLHLVESYSTLSTSSKSIIITTYKEYSSYLPKINNVEYFYFPGSPPTREYNLSKVEMLYTSSTALTDSIDLSHAHEVDTFNKLTTQFSNKQINLMIIDPYMFGAIDFAEVNEIPYILFHTVPFAMEFIIRPILCETDAEESENWMKYTKCLVINTYYYAKFNYQRRTRIDRLTKRNITHSTLQYINFSPLLHIRLSPQNLYHYPNRNVNTYYISSFKPNIHKLPDNLLKWIKGSNQMCLTEKCSRKRIAIMYIDHINMNDYNDDFLTTMISYVTSSNFRLLWVIPSRLFNYFSYLQSSPLIKLTKDSFGNLESIIENVKKFKVYISNCNLASLSYVTHKNVTLLCIPHTPVEYSISLKLQNLGIAKILNYNEKQPSIATFINLPDAVNHRNYRIFMSDFRVNGGLNSLVTLIDGYVMLNKTRVSIPREADNMKLFNTTISLTFYIIFMSVIYKMSENVYFNQKETKEKKQK